MQPLRDLLLIEPDEKNNKTETGIIFQEAWETPVCSGIVLGVGNEVKEIKVGQHIQYNPYALLELITDPIKKKTTCFLKEKDVVGLINE